MSGKAKLNKENSMIDLAFSLTKNSTLFPSLTLVDTLIYKTKRTSLSKEEMDQALKNGISTNSH